MNSLGLFAFYECMGIFIEISLIYHPILVMFKIFLSVLVFVSSLSLVSAIGEGDRIELAITPIKKELQIAPG